MNVITKYNVNIHNRLRGRWYSLLGGTSHLFLFKKGGDSHGWIAILAILGLLEAVFTMLGALFDMLTSESENMLSSSRGTPQH
jgi:hypothetical protein